ncbi:Dynamin-1 [Dactylellina cionopaga]|nr:Dynamin-1 [Dactylellina cionopaga]
MGFFSANTSSPTNTVTTVHSDQYLSDSEGDDSANISGTYESKGNYETNGIYEPNGSGYEPKGNYTYDINGTHEPNPIASYEANGTYDIKGNHSLYHQELNTASLEALQDDGQRKILDVVDNLKRIGLSNVLSLPQLVVCGDQSSGKSSVLEAITEIPFPRKENLCTRFATEIILRRSPQHQVTTTINPNPNRPENQQAALRRFTRTITDFHELPGLIDQATELMCLETGRAFSKDVLTIEIAGPNRPQLTLVDLPGLIHSKNKSQTEEDIVLIRELVEEYISNPRTIILAIVSAKNDYANQIILDFCQKVDPSGSRTLGIITKPDMLRSGSDNERAWIDLATNKDIHLELGWHIVKNREDGDMVSSFEQRNTAERSFFFKEPYRTLSREMLGVASLRTRLSRVLKEHLKREVPGLSQELRQMLDVTVEDLEKLGERRTTFQEQSIYLARTAMSIQAIADAAIQGRYDHPFFDLAGTDIGADKNIGRLRAVVQHLNLEFSRDIQLYGRKTMIVNEGKLDPGEFEVETWVERKLLEWAKDTEKNTDAERSRIDLVLPRKVSRDEAIDHVCEVMALARGRELPGSFNPQVIGMLFREQSEPWKLIASLHLDSVATTCSVFVDMLLDYCTSKDLKQRLWASKVEKSLKSAVKAAKAELQKILEDKDRHPITYNHYYTTNVQKLRQQKIGQRIKTMVGESTVTVNTYTAAGEVIPEQYISPVQLEASLLKNKDLPDTDRFAAEEAFDSERTYYKVIRNPQTLPL